ncbi:MAG TPA: methyltransferase domain-containing protein [Planctomycetota bacterium]|nr:methyltransferase domain-containing protein [Planctomycetota bacterium]
MRLQQFLGSGYVSADLMSSLAMLKLDITALPFGRHSFDVILCSHVLEHVVEDAQAMREMVRVLKPGGYALLMVPITADATIEDRSATSPEERLRLFGQADHVRRYGRDFTSRLQKAGFEVETVRVAGVFSTDEALKMGLHPPDRELYFARPVS